MTPDTGRRLRRRIRDVWAGCTECHRLLDARDRPNPPLPCEACVREAVRMILDAHPVSGPRLAVVA